MLRAWLRVCICLGGCKCEGEDVCVCVHSWVGVFVEVSLVPLCFEANVKFV